MTWSSGLRIDERFELDRKIGAGGNGIVWRAHDLERNRAEVAIKTLLRHDSARAQLRFAREAEVLKRLEHPAIARIVGANLVGELPYIAIEFVAGATLGWFLRMRSASEEQLSMREVVAIARQLTSALAHAHGLGIAHRDLTPNNIMLIEGSVWTIKVLDFGLAKLFEEPNDDGTTIGRVIGTPLYRAPESWIGLSAGPASDLYALGVLLFEMLTLRHAFGIDEHGVPLPLHTPVAGSENNDPQQLAARIIAGKRPNVREFRADVDGSLGELIDLLLQPEPERRPTMIGKVELVLASLAKDKAFDPTLIRTGTTNITTRVTRTLLLPPKGGVRRSTIGAALGVTILAGTLILRAFISPGDDIFASEASSIEPAEEAVLTEHGPTNVLGSLAETRQPPPISARAIAHQVDPTIALREETRVDTREEPKRAVATKPRSLQGQRRRDVERSPAAELVDRAKRDPENRKLFFDARDAVLARLEQVPSADTRADLDRRIASISFTRDVEALGELLDQIDRSIDR